MTTFTDAELDALMRDVAEAREEVDQYVEEEGIIVTDYGLVPKMVDAITYLRAQLSERDPIGAAVMRDRANDIALRHLSKIAVNEPLWHDGADWAAQRISDAIRAIPLPTPAETLAYALQLPEIKALVEAARQDASQATTAEIPEGYGPDVSENPEFHRGFDDAIRCVRHALAALEPKP